MSCMLGRGLSAEGARIEAPRREGVGMVLPLWQIGRILGKIVRFGAFCGPSKTAGPGAAASTPLNAAKLSAVITLQTYGRESRS